MKFNYDMSIYPYIINWKRGSSRGGEGIGREGRVRGGDFKKKYKKTTFT